MRTTLILTAATLLPLAAGCASTGLSAGERGANNMNGHLYTALSSSSIYASTRGTPTLELNLPTRVAVAQLGEVSPDQELLDVLRASQAFSTVASLPGTAEPGATDFRRPGESAEWVRQRVEQMRHAAAALGADTLLLVGGQMETTNDRTPLSVLDLTIIGAFIVPSRDIDANAKGLAALVDVKTGRLLLTASSQENGSRLAASVGSKSSERGLSLKVRRTLMTSLGEAVVAQANQR